MVNVAAGPTMVTPPAVFIEFVIFEPSTKLPSGPRACYGSHLARFRDDPGKEGRRCGKEPPPLHHGTPFGGLFLRSRISAGGSAWAGSVMATPYLIG